MPAKNYNNYMKEYMLARYHRRRSEAIEKLGGECAKCGSREDLEIDHINKEDKGFSIGKLWSCSQEKFDKEVEKCQVLCSPCHTEKSVKEHAIWMKESKPRICDCGKTFGNHNKYSGHRRWCRV